MSLKNKKKYILISSREILINEFFINIYSSKYCTSFIYFLLNEKDPKIN